MAISQSVARLSQVDLMTHVGLVGYENEPGNDFKSGKPWQTRWQNARSGAKEERAEQLTKAIHSTRETGHLIGSLEIFLRQRKSASDRLMKLQLG